ncbi:MAG: hypothetical protein KTR16_14210, partial [Acidiferrobacterales bacterium]|nr:hypothetical protein [Acidiferrobacterales bacterium]
MANIMSLMLNRCICRSGLVVLGLLFTSQVLAQEGTVATIEETTTYMSYVWIGICCALVLFM